MYFTVWGSKIEPFYKKGVVRVRTKSNKMNWGGVGCGAVRTEKILRNVVHYLIYIKITLIPLRPLNLLKSHCHQFREKLLIFFAMHITYR